GVVTVVDTKALSEGRFASDEEAIAAQRAADPNVDHENPIEELFEDQLNCADMVILNKTDLLDRDELEMLSGEMRGKVRKGTRLVPARNGALDVSALLGVKAAAEDDMDNRLSHHEMEGEVQHDHDDFVTFAVALEGTLERTALLLRIEKVLTEHDVLRLKGFANIESSSARLLVQAVGPRLDSYFDRPWKKDEPRGTNLVVIAMKGIDKAAVQSALKG
ncbi:MAG: cobalamin biosynthesis protein CobW, partial [Rhodospirillales bacterium]|nr:cobalamin biosynthesis protein CobW [Rhodospirillales bacterium]